ncbi:hypothetical protein DICPUDRAFT_73130 [Dictyostelium purpureum]|uniref:N-acetyltransferase domain-containing protein n=1 Tax=Dictyostelium purpureum TaxID=5786 RepID=F0ZW19_DICPU|nr:uncharacterized protein DICPUDRAFT_73130 [Dictyostelium purpureum]EGC31879.1 hypothetical protein DICPUDRAFT_73130 [Dictyostelium purpureum]|eukprot:XP_003291613.1 hypothetical protein DICPUDRAFT_73130 [Dictyostelium purpureum]
MDNININKNSITTTSFQYFKQAQEKYVKEWDWKAASKKAFSTDQTLKILEPKQQKVKKTKSSSSSASSLNNTHLEQTVIDAGQKNVGQMVCQKCKMLYSYGSKEDEIAHQSFCNGNIQQQKVIIKNWKSLKIVNLLHNGQGIIAVNRDDTSIISKIKQIKQIINTELGYTEKLKKSESNDDDDDEKLFLYLDANGRVLGCLVAERVEKGYKIQVSSPTIECIKTPSKILCGIDRIWVLPSHRKRGIALKLIESLRSNMYYGYHLKKNEIAVTQPSTSGLSFFTKYFETDQFLLYKINQ